MPNYRDGSDRYSPADRYRPSSNDRSRNDAYGARSSSQQQSANQASPYSRNGYGDRGARSRAGAGQQGGSQGRNPSYGNNGGGYPDAGASMGNGYQQGRPQNRRAESHSGTEIATRSAAQQNGAYGRGAQSRNGYEAASSNGNPYARGQGSMHAAPQRGRRKSKRKKIIIIVVVAIVAVVLGVGGAAWAYKNSIDNELHNDISDMGALENSLTGTQTAGEPFYILLMGVDTRSYETDEQDHSDSMILARIDPQTKRAVMVSIHRDIPVMYKGQYQKMNYPHMDGGPAATVDVVSNFAGVKISHYAEINFDGFADLIDDIGGIQIDVVEHVDATDTEGVPLYNRDGSEAVDLEPGLQTLNGDQALTFCRSRTDYNGDQQRSANQRIVIEAVANKILNMPYNEMLTYVNDIAKTISTDLTSDEIIQIASELQGMTSDDIYSYMVPTDGFYDEDGSVYGYKNCWWEKVYDDDWKAMMAAIDAGKLPEEQSEYFSGAIADEYKNDTATATTSTTTTSSATSSTSTG